MTGSSIVRDDVFVFLQENSLGTLVTVGDDGTPHPAAIFFHIENNFTIQFITKMKTRKFMNAEKHPRITLYVYSEEKLTSVTIVGECKMIYDTLEFAHVIEHFQNVIGDDTSKMWLPPVAQIEAGHYAACALIPSSIRYKRFAVTPYDPVFPQEFTFSPNITEA